MEDFVLKASLEDCSNLYISPIDRHAYAEHVSDDNLGGDEGYFLVRSRREGFPRLEVLAKVPTLDAAQVVFELIVGKAGKLTAA